MTARTPSSMISIKIRSAKLAAKIAVELGLPADYWPEYGLAKVISKARTDGAERDRLYAELPESVR